MNGLQKIFNAFSLLMLTVAMFFGLLASLAFIYPEALNPYIPFYQLRPIHVSAALFWIISGAVTSVLYYSRDLNPMRKIEARWFMLSWMLTVLVIFISYALKKFGGREYWEFPPWLSIPLLLSWLLLMRSFFTGWFSVPGKTRLYVMMWSTGILFFLLTFIEQNLWQFAWFRSSFIREITVQWKANGAMVGAWNQMIYGTSLFLMCKLSGNNLCVQDRKAYFFYFLGLSNLMFNWGHHIYNLPTAGWIRHVSYAISMTEWLIFLSIVRGFRARLSEADRLRHLITYRFIAASEFWVFVNLLLALLMSIPAINRYTHGTHITVAHAMGTTIGINTMILLGAFAYMLKIDEESVRLKKTLIRGYWLSQASLLIFWMLLISAGLIKAFTLAANENLPFRDLMEKLLPWMKMLFISGLGLFAGLGAIVLCYMKVMRRESGEELTGNKVETKILREVQR